MFLGYAHRRTIGSAPTVYSNGWPYRITAIGAPAALGLTVSVEPLILWVPRTDNNLRSTGNAGLVESTAGWDLRYELRANGKLAHELATYNPVTGLTGSFVRFPSVDPNEQLTLDLYFGRAGLLSTEADSMTCWAGAHGVINLATGADPSGQGADVTLTGVTATSLVGMPAGDFSPTAVPPPPSIGDAALIGGSDHLLINGADRLLI